MSWGGKIILGVVGLLVAGPVGLAIGVLVGHFLDRGVERVQTFNPFRPYGPGEKQAIHDALFEAVFSILGHLAKSDGHVSEAEIAQAESVMLRMGLSGEQRKEAIRLFNEGKSEGFPLDETVAAFAKQVRHRQQLVLVFLEILMQSALADGQLDAAEEAVLIRVATGLGVPEAQFRQILKMLLAQAQFASGEQWQKGAHRGAQAGVYRPSVQQAYQVLGVSESSSNHDVKKAYRKLMSQHHPDKLAAKGVPKEMVRVATEKTAEIGKAYDMIKEVRGL